MKSSRTSAEPELPQGRRTLLAAEGGAPAIRLQDRDPFESLDDLMAVVEALCPAYPPRPGFGPMPRMRL